MFFCGLYFLYAVHLLHTVDFCKLLNDRLQELVVFYLEFYFAVEDALLRQRRETVYVDVEIVRQQCRYVTQYSFSVYAS